MRILTTIALICTISSLLLGCSGADRGGDTGSNTSSGALGDSATLTFAADGQVTLSGNLVEGGQLRVSYDANRLPDCRGDFEGKPAWTITGFASVAGGDAQSFATDHVAVVTLPSHGDLALWFQVTNRWGCSAYDSKYGANYHFDVASSSGGTVPTIAFDKNGGITQSGDLVGGGKVTIRYAQDRLTTCRGTNAGYAQWAITGFASVNGGAPESFATTEASANANRDDVDATIDLPSSGDLAVWFQNTDRWGCNAYDSKNGQNYHFRVR